MNILFLGSGTSTGVPSLCCNCSVCLSDDKKNKRLRSSILIRNKGNHLLIDTSTDLRQQCLTNDITHINQVLYTHHHADHLHGIDELRSFNFFNKVVIPCYGNKETINEISRLLKNKYKMSTGDSYKNSEYISKYGLYLPSSLDIKNSEIKFICNKVNAILK